MSEEYIIRNCAPTLAGLKTGSMFTCPVTSDTELRNALRSLNRRLSKKGLRLIPLRISDKSALIYVFRPGRLSEDLKNTTTESLLTCRGYSTDNCAGCIQQLIRRIREERDFPHEVGLFLGYPPEDVHGFIENKSCNHKCVGCWKVYGDEDAAKRRFALYKKCNRIYWDQWTKGIDLEKLTDAE